jgi:hypothetical protein
MHPLPASRGTRPTRERYGNAAGEVSPYHSAAEKSGSGAVPGMRGLPRSRASFACSWLSIAMIANSTPT